jgi:hypothetical protein
MLCPNCKAEYRFGFTRCSDCDVDLVHELSQQGLPSGDGFTLLWECDYQPECVSICEQLRKAEIPYRVDQIPYEKTTGMQVLWHYRIAISAEDFDRAKKLLDIDGPQNTISLSDSDDDEVVDPAVELADAGTPLTAEWNRSGTYLDPWYPEDATVEVWSQNADDLSSGIERALDANYIHCRCDSDERRANKIFVLPEDEAFAREIIREIIEGTPLK